MPLVRKSTLFLLSVAAGALVLAAVAIGRQSRAPQKAGSRSVATAYDVRREFIPDTPANRMLADAAMAGDLSAVRAALAKGADPDTVVRYLEQEPKDVPVAMLAVGATEEQAQRRLVFREILAGVKKTSASVKPLGQTLLTTAIHFEDLESVRLLVKRGANVNTQSTGVLEGLTPLYWAVTIGNANIKTVNPITAFLLENGANPNVQDKNGWTVLFTAASYGKTDVVAALLKHGADATIRDKAGRTALDYAAKRNFADVVALLDAKTPMDLVQAAQFVRLDRMKAALDTGTDPDAKDSRGWAPLIAAVQSGRPEAVRLLLERGARIDVADSKGRQPIHHAASLGHEGLFGLLAEHGADLSARGGSREMRGELDTPLTEAVYQARLEAVRELLKRGVDLKKHDQGVAALAVNLAMAGQIPSPMGNAPRERRNLAEVQTAQAGIFEALIEAGVDVKRADRALYFAVGNGQVDLVRILLDRGANVNARSPHDFDPEERGQTVLSEAVSQIGMSRGMAGDIADGTMTGSITLSDAKEEKGGRVGSSTYC